MAKSLREHQWRLRYNNDQHDLIDDFYIPALSAAVSYDRKAGFFSSSALVVAAKGVSQLVRNQGRMRLLVSHHLSEQDCRALQQGYELQTLLKEELKRQLRGIEEGLPRERLKVLAWLVAHGHLEVQVVMRQRDGELVPGALFHEKCGIFTDAEGEQLAFSGSINESARAWQENQEEFNVFTSWGPAVDYLEAAKADFERLWKRNVNKLSIVSFTQAFRDGMIHFVPKEPPIHVDLEPPTSHHFIPPSQGQLGFDGGEGYFPPTQGQMNFVAEPQQPYHPIAEPPSLSEPSKTLREEREQFLKIREAPKQGLAGQKLTFSTSSVSPWPHQQRVFLRATASDPANFLFCDEVGLGKTIEAGSLIRYLRMSGKVRRVLLLVPKSVIWQWHQEVYEKFNLHFWVYDNGEFCNVHGKKVPVTSANTWNQHELTLVSSHLARRPSRMRELVSAERFDLVVVDEAHHARRRNPTQRSQCRPNRMLELLSQLRPRTRHLFLLTATPMQIDMIEAWDLLRHLNIRGIWSHSPDSFIRFYQELQEGISSANAGSLVLTAKQSIDAGHQIPDVREDELYEQFTPNLVRRLTRYLRRGQDTDVINLMKKEPGGQACLESLLQELAPLKQRMFRSTREQLREYKRQGVLKESIATRRPEDVFITFSPEEAELYKALDEYITRFFTIPEGQQRHSLGFVLSIYRRRMTSSLAALRMSLERRRAKLTGSEGSFLDADDDMDENGDGIDDISDEEQEGVLFSTQGLAITNEIKKIDELLFLLKQSKIDTKFEDFQKKLKSFLGKGHYQAVVFTQYTDTMDYLRDKLRPIYGAELACYSGRGGEFYDGYRWMKCSKEDIKNRFRAQELQLLLCTDSAAEGLNLQTSGLLFNYDMPWNPMRVEQRIGRIDRIGQQKPEVHIANFYYEDTVEAQIYEVLRDRIQCFETVVGVLQPILTTIESRIQSVALHERGLRETILELERDLDEAQRGIDFTAFSEGGVTYQLNEVEPSITNREIEDSFVLAKLPSQLGYKFTPNERLPNSYTLALPDGTTHTITFQPEVFDTYPDSVQLFNYQHPLFETLLDTLLAQQT